MATTYVNKNNPNLTLTPNEQDLGTRQGGESDITFGERLANSGYVPANSSQNTTVNLPVTQNGNLNIPSNNQSNLFSNLNNNQESSNLSTVKPTTVTSDIYNSYVTNLSDRTNKLKEQTDSLKSELQTRADQDINRINSDYSRREAELRKSQEGENATQSATNFRLGRTGTIYGDSDVNKLNDAHNQALNALNAERENLVQGVRRALEDNNVKLANQLLQNANDVSDKIYETQRQQRADQLQAAQVSLQINKDKAATNDKVIDNLTPNIYALIQENPNVNQSDIIDFYSNKYGLDPNQLNGKVLEYQRANAKGISEEAQKRIENLVKGGISIDQLDSKTISDLESRSGLPTGTFATYYDALNASEKAKTDKDRLDASNKIIDILSKIPEGQQIRLNGVSYSGLKDIDSYKGLSTTTETDDNGNVTQITTKFNPDSGKVDIVGITSLGKIGKVAKSSQEENSSFDPANLAAYAQQYAATGQIPTGLPKGTFGVVAQVAKNLPKPVGTLVDINTGIKPSKLNDSQLNGITALYDIQQKVQELKNLDDKRIGGVIPGALGKVFGSNNQAKYIALRDEIIDLLARARTGAALTVDEENRYASMLPGRFSEPFGLGADSDKRIDNFTKNIVNSLDSKLKINGLQIVGYGEDANKINEAGDKIFDLPSTSNPTKPLSTGANGSSNVTTSIKIGDKPIKVSSLIATPLAMADKDFFEATGKHLQINEALRSHERQAELYDRFRSGKGGRAAPPGKSFHETGKAVDIANYKEAEPYLRKYGFRNDLADDRNHFSIGEFS